jgi:two-component system, OmpR family, sensor histidine kinase KdpD
VGTKARAEALGWAGWIGALGALTAVLVSGRGYLDKVHFALLYLLLVLAGSVRGSRRRGTSLAVLAFLCFNFFLLPPYYTFELHDPFDWIVLFTFLAVAWVATQLLNRVRREAEDARQRADEINRIAALGAETLNAGRAEEALQGIASVIQSSLGVDLCEIWLRTDGASRLGASAGSPLRPDETGSGQADLSAELASVVFERRDGTTRVVRVDGAGLEAALSQLGDSRGLSLPLQVRSGTAGVLRLASDRGISLAPHQRRFFIALSYYAALAAERVRLSAEAKRAEALSEADRLKDALIASVSHDLRTPLTTIKGVAQAIARDGDERALDIEAEADRLNRFIADLLDLSRLNAGELRLTIQVNAAEDLIGTALQSASGSLADRDVRVHLDPTEPLLLGRFDFVHSLRALVNLLENANKYAPRGTPVEVTTLRAGDQLVIEIADRGPGVPQSEVEHVFAPFYRARGAEPDVGGAGLGLSIARRLAEAQGGSVAYRTRAGGGSVFALSLPAAELADLGDDSTAAST